MDDIEAQYGVVANKEFSNGEEMGDNTEDHVDCSTDGEFDYLMQYPLGEFICDEEMGDAEGDYFQDAVSYFEQREDSDSSNLESQINDNNEAQVQKYNNGGGKSFYEPRLIEEIENRKLELMKAAIIGDWRKAKEIFVSYPRHIPPTTRLNKLGETALHLATAANRIEFVEELVNLMNEDDLAVKTYGPGNTDIEIAVDENQQAEDELGSKSYHGEGNTALCYAAVSGNIRTAICMLDRNPNLSTIRGEEDILPIRIAAWHGHYEMVRYLYYQFLEHHNLEENDCIDVLMAFIDCDIYGMAIQMVLEKPWLATIANSKGLTALHAFARKSRITSNKFRTNKIFLNEYFSKRQEILQEQALALIKLLLELAMSDIGERSSKLIKKALFEAAEKGNSEFISAALEMNPDLAFELDENSYTIFHIALLYRHMDIFNKVHEMDSIQNVIRLTKDKEGNNILHLAGKMPLSELLDVPGVALQLQHELFWFQKVKTLVGKHLVEAKNCKGKTPHELFAAEHESLRQKGEEWMKYTINSCMVVATLVAGVAFAAAITVPGGNTESSGIPILLHHNWFEVFAIFNALSLIFSASSISLFLTILISDYSLGDFLESLPTKFTAGLLFLSAAVQTMLVAFIAASFVLFKQQKIGFAYAITAIGLIPVSVFGYGHTRHAFRYLYLLFAFQKQRKSFSQGDGK